MRCTACNAELPAGFPGGTVTCTACGARASMPAPVSRGPLSAGGPYRGGSVVPMEEPANVPCPYCGNRVAVLARVCPHCDVRLENVRCARCFSLQQPGSFTCGRCGKALELEPLLDATNAPCPRCRTPLEAAEEGRESATNDIRVHECPRCGGAFVPRDVIAEMLARAELEGPFSNPLPRTVKPLEEVRYVSCPLCHASMNRLNFGRVSGVIVDVCRMHGSWFDGGELTAVLAFAANGGLAKTRAREAEESAARKKETAKMKSEHFVVRGHDASAELANDWSALLRDLFFW